MTGARQTFKTLDVLRLEVETPRTGLVNLLEDADMTQGAVGWIAAQPAGSTANPYLDAYPTTSPPSLRLVTYENGATGTCDGFVRSEAQPMNPGQWVTSRVTLVEFGSYVPSHTGTRFAGARFKFRFIGADGATISLSGASVFRGVGTWVFDPQQAPAGTVEVALEINFAVNSSGTLPSSTEFLYAATATFADARMAVSPTNAAVNFDAAQPRTFTNILGSSTSLSIKRAPLDVGLLTGTLRDVALDPASSGLLSPGAIVRARALVGGTWETFFTGRVLTGEVEYDFSTTGPKRAIITLSAVDAGSVLAQARRRRGSDTVVRLAGNVMESLGVPWDINNNPGQPYSYSAADTPGASALDQISITRDTERAFAWVDRLGRLVVKRSFQMASTVVGTLTNATVGQVLMNYSTDDLINEITVKSVKLNTTTGETTEVDLGPYYDRRSVRKHGVRREEFRLIGMTNAEAKTWARGVLDANADPMRRVQSVRIPLATTGDVTAWALVDHYDTVRLNLAAAGIDQTLRTVGIEHTITTDKWLLDLSFVGPTTVPRPRATPSAT